VGRDVIEPTAAPVESGERRSHDAVAFTPDDAEPGVARRHRGERRVVVTRSIADPARAPEGAQRITVVLSKIAELHRRPY